MKKTYTPVYYVSDRTPQVGTSPIHHPSLAILVGHADRGWFERRSVHGLPRPIGSIGTVIPLKPDFDGALLDALIAFWPDRFRTCPSLAVVERKLQNASVLDFNIRPDRIPPEWEALRKEARPIYEALLILRVDGQVAAPESFLISCAPGIG